jgi:drug/metabolite transporter (DMT)-like permease
MWLLLQGWLLRNALGLLGWLAAAAAVAGVLFGARQAGRTAEPVEDPSRCSVTTSRLRAAVIAIAASLLAGCATERSDGARCPAVVDTNYRVGAPGCRERVAALEGATVKPLRQLTASWRS